MSGAITFHTEVDVDTECTVCGETIHKGETAFVEVGSGNRRVGNIYGDHVICSLCEFDEFKEYDEVEEKW